MDTNEIKMGNVAEAVIDGAEKVIDVTSEAAKDTVKFYVCGACLVTVGVTIAAQQVWKRALKPGISKLRSMKKQHDEAKLESYVDTGDDRSENQED